jgi:two-component system, LytTR family, sensor kinase
MRRYLLSVYTIHLLIWSVFYWLNISYFKNWLPQIGMYISDTRIWLYVGIVFVAVYFAAVYINQLVLLPRFFLKKRYAMYSLLVTGLLLFCCLIKVEIDAQFLTVTVAWLRTPGHYISTLPYLLFTMGLSSWQTMAYAHRKERQRADKLQSIQTEAELRWLKAQLNPHFLFNALNNIYTLAYVKSDEAAPMLLKLSEMMRYVMNDAGRSRVPVEDEIRYMVQFVALHGLKKVNREKTSLHIVNTSAGVELEPLLLINFVENAFKHGNMDDTNARIDIDWQITNDRMLFRCNNTFNPADRKDRQSGIGLENVQKRLALLYPHHRLQVRETDTMYMVELELNFH